MKRFALTTMLAASIFAGLIGTAGTAHAEHDYVDPSLQHAPRQFVPHVDMSVRNRSVIVRH